LVEDGALLGRSADPNARLAIAAAAREASRLRPVSSGVYRNSTLDALIADFLTPVTDPLLAIR
jgi:hypothetical protein